MKGRTRRRQAEYKPMGGAAQASPSHAAQWAGLGLLQPTSGLSCHFQLVVHLVLVRISIKKVERIWVAFVLKATDSYSPKPKVNVVSWNGFKTLLFSNGISSNKNFIFISYKNIIGKRANALVSLEGMGTRPCVQILSKSLQLPKTLNILSRKPTALEKKKMRSWFHH